MRSLDATRPTAVNLRWALERVRAQRRAAAARRARRRGVARGRPHRRARTSTINHAIGVAGLELLRDIARKRGGPVNVMTHCNAGALATLRLGHGHRAAVPRARRRPAAARVGERDASAAAGRQPDRVGDGAARHPAHAVRRLGERRCCCGAATSTSSSSAPTASRATATCATRSARTTRRWPRATTTLPFYVALPSPTIDWALASGDAIPIEARDGDEVLTATGRDDYGQASTVAHRASGHARRQLRLRRDAGAAGHGPRHRARHRALGVAARRDLPRARRGCARDVTT